MNFQAEFEKYMKDMRDQMKSQYNRVLPSGELIFNRFDKAQYLKCGKKTSIYDAAVVMGDVEIGDHVWIGPFTVIDGYHAHLRIGNFVSIDSGTMIYTHDSTKYYVGGGELEKGPVFIDDHTVIGSMCIIRHGVKIGKHCVIGANSYVTKDIGDYNIAAGTPAEIIGKVNINDTEVEFEYFEKRGNA